MYSFSLTKYCNSLFVIFNVYNFAEEKNILYTFSMVIKYKIYLGYIVIHIIISGRFCIT